MSPDEVSVWKGDEHEANPTQRPPDSVAFILHAVYRMATKNHWSVATPDVLAVDTPCPPYGLQLLPYSVFTLI